MSINLPEQALNAAKSVIIDYYSDRPSYGFLVSTMALTDLAVALSCSINKYVESRDIDISIFSSMNEPATIVPFASIFNISDINVFFGHLIATDIPTWIYLSNAQDNPIFYVFDPVKLNYANKRLIDQMKAKKTIFIARSEYHKKYLSTKFNITAHQVLVPDFEIPLFERIFNEYESKKDAKTK